jgi:single-strand DNA-binding protein
MQSINAVAITGNLTRDPELREAGSTKICGMRIAFNTRVKRGDDWQDKANYADVTVFGGQGENCHRYLSKGRGVAISGRLDWSEWTDKDNNKRQSLQIIADNVQFISDGKDHDSGGEREAAPATSSAPPADDFAAPVSSAVDDDIPFHHEGVTLDFEPFHATTYR